MWWICYKTRNVKEQQRGDSYIFFGLVDSKESNEAEVLAMPQAI